MTLAGGQERAPRRPPEPFRVFAYFIETADAALKANLEEAMPMVRERVERRNKWFQLVDSAETAEITLRITHYRQANLNLLVQSRPDQSDARLLGDGVPLRGCGRPRR